MINDINVPMLLLESLCYNIFFYINGLIAIIVFL